MERSDDEAWIPLDAESGAAFQNEALIEVAPGHELFGLTLVPVSRCPMCDTVAFRLPDESFALVHLTWIQRADTPPWPDTIRLGGFSALESAIDQHAH